MVKSRILNLLNSTSSMKRAISSGKNIHKKLATLAYQHHNSLLSLNIYLTAMYTYAHARQYNTRAWTPMLVFAY